MNSITKSIIEEYFCNLHDNACNQKYGKEKILPYSFHLKAVVSQAKLFKNYIPTDIEHEITVCMGLFGHDSIEDARLTYNDICNLRLRFEDNTGRKLDIDDIDRINKIAADIIFGCTESAGRNRKERHDDAYYNRLLNNKFAVFVKLCDLIANIKYSILENSSMYDTYQVEWKHSFRPKLENTYTSDDNPILYSVLYSDMIIHIDSLVSINCQL